MDSEKKNFKVNIFGSEYLLRAESEESEILKVAAYVDQKMREIHAVKMNRPVHQIAILAALNIAEELFQQRRQGSGDCQDLKEKIIRLTRELELGIEGLSEVDEQVKG